MLRLSFVRLSILFINFAASFESHISKSLKLVGSVAQLDRATAF